MILIKYPFVTNPACDEVNSQAMPKKWKRSCLGTEGGVGILRRGVVYYVSDMVESGSTLAATMCGRGNGATSALCAALAFQRLLNPRR